MKTKFKILLGAIGVIAPLAISTPFIISCSQTKEQEPQKQYRYYVKRGGGCYYVYKQVLEGYNNYFQPLWKNVDDGTTIIERDWEAFVANVEKTNIPLVYE